MRSCTSRARKHKSLSLARSLFFGRRALFCFSLLSLFFSLTSLSLLRFIFRSVCFCFLSFLLFPAILNASVREVFRERHFAVLRNARACTREKREREKETTQRERERETRRERVNQYSLPTEVSLSLRSFSPA